MLYFLSQTRGVRSVPKRKGRHPQYALTDLMIRKLKEPAFLCDGSGLYLRCDENLNKRWVLLTTVFGKRQPTGLGSYSPVNGVAIARQRAARYRQIAKEGKDPNDYRVIRDPTATKPEEGWSIVL